MIFAEAEAAHASDIVVLQHAVAHKERGAELIGQLNFGLGHYILAGPADAKALAVEVLDALMRTAKLSAKSRERVAGAYAAFCSKRNAPPRISSSLGDPTPCAVVHPRNGLAGRLAEVTWQEESDASSASGMSDLPEGVVGAAESHQFCRSPTAAQPDTQQPQAGLHGLEPDAACEGAAQEDEQEQSDHHMSAPIRHSDSEVSEDPTTGPSMSGQPDSSREQQAQRQDRPSGHEELESDSVPADAASGDLERASGSAQQDVRSTSGADDEGLLSGAPQPHGSPALVADTGKLAEPQPAAEAASSHSLDQQSKSPFQGEEGEPVARAPPPPPSASLLDASPLWPTGIAMQEPDSGEQEQDPLVHAAPGLPPQPPGLAQPAQTTIESYSISSHTSSSSDDVEVTADEPLGQAASDSKMNPSWGASNRHGRAGIGEGTEADPVVLSSDSGEEGQEDDGTEQVNCLVEGPTINWMRCTTINSATVQEDAAAIVCRRLLGDSLVETADVVAMS